MKTKSHASVRSISAIKPSSAARTLAPSACSISIVSSAEARALIRLAHSLAGAAGTFGFPEISVRASALETLLVEQADGGAIGTALDALIAEIERALE